MGHGHGGKGDAGGKGAAAILTPVALTTGADSVGTSGNDWITATAATLNSGDSLVGGDGFDTISLSGSGVFNFSTLASFSGFERIQGGSADQTIILKDGLSLTVDLGSGHNTLTAASGNTLVVTHGGTDTITGGSGSLTVRAEAGVSTIIAGSGGSHLDIGYGTVNLTAGSGVDVIDIGHGSGQATVSGFAQGTDKIDVHELHVSSYAELQAVASITSSGGNTTITVTGGDTITLVGVSSVTESDFVFSSTSSAMHC